MQECMNERVVLIVACQLAIRIDEIREVRENLATLYPTQRQTAVQTRCRLRISYKYDVVITLCMAIAHREPCQFTGVTLYWYMYCMLLDAVLIRSYNCRYKSHRGRGQNHFLYNIVANPSLTSSFSNSVQPRSAASVSPMGFSIVSQRKMIS